MPGEEEALLAAADPGMRWRIIMGLETAMRRGEILDLKPEYVHGSVIRIPDTKNGRSRAVPLSSRARGILHPFPPRIGRESFEWRWRKLRPNDDLRFHDLRHEAISRLFEKGLSAMEVMAISGHRTTDMLKRYTHFEAEKLVDKLG